MLNHILNFFSHDVGIDLGTANTLILVRGKGIVINQPSVVARSKKTKQVIAIGHEAKKMLGKTPDTIEAVKPLVGGVIADFDAAEAMLSHWIKVIHQGKSWPTLRIGGSARPLAWFPRLPRPRVAVGIPAGVTEVERRAVAQAALEAGARQVFLIEEPMAAAIGAGIPILEPEGQIIVDIGGGTTEIAVISLGGIVVNKSMRTAGDEMTEAIVGFSRAKYGLIIGEPTAEEIKITIGSAVPLPQEEKRGQLIHIARGRDLETGLPKSIKFTGREIREAIAPVINQIISAIGETIENTPPELVSDLLKHGLIMTGGGSQLKGLTKLIADEIKMPVWLADKPMETVVRGCEKVLEDPDLLKRVKVIGSLK